MADYETLFPGRFLKSADLAERDAIVTIKSVTGEEIEGKAKAIMTFEGTKKQMVLNRTNAEAVRLMFGREMKDWIGRKITLTRRMMKDPFGADDAPEVGAIRVKGSPEIDKPMSAEVKRGKKTLHVKVVPTPTKGTPPKSNGGNGGAKPETPPSSPQTPSNGEPSEEEKQAILAKEFEQAEQDRPF